MINVFFLFLFLFLPRLSFVCLASSLPAGHAVFIQCTAGVHGSIQRMCFGWNVFAHMHNRTSACTLHADEQRAGLLACAALWRIN